MAVAQRHDANTGCGGYLRGGGNLGNQRNRRGSGNGGRLRDRGRDRNHGLRGDRRGHGRGRGGRHFGNLRHRLGDGGQDRDRAGQVDAQRPLDLLGQRRRRRGAGGGRPQPGQDQQRHGRAAHRQLATRFRRSRQHLQPPFQIIDGMQVTGARQRAAMRGLYDGAGIDMTVGPAAPLQDAGVIGQLLVGTESVEGPPRQRIEPMERQHGERDPVGDQVTPRVMAQLVRQRQVALVGVVPLGKIAREGDVAVPDAEGERSRCAIAGDHAHPLHRLQRLGIGQQPRAEAPVAKELKAQEPRRPDDPEQRNTLLDHRPDAGRIHRGGNLRSHGQHDIGREALARGGQRRGRLLGQPARQRRQEQAEQRQGPERIGNLRPEGLADMTAGQQDQRHQESGGDHRLHRPAELRPAHAFRSLSSASISEISCAVSSSRSAKCATSGVRRPPNNRSIRRRDSPMT